VDADRIFIGPHGLRAGWRFALFAVVVLLLLAAQTALVQYRLLTILPAYTIDMLREALALACVLVGMWVMSRVENRPVSAFGLSPADRGRNFAAGIGSGFLTISALVGGLVAIRCYSFGAPGLHGVDILAWGAFLAVDFLLVGLFEELFMRGYPLYSVGQGIGFWPAAAIFAVLFGLGHIGNRGEEILGVVNAMLAGLVFAYTLRWSGSLWWAIGCHASWDWGESFFYGVADSGGTSSHHWLTGHPHGVAWLSGGSVGPEGSLLAIPAILLWAVLVRATAKERKATPA